MDLIFESERLVFKPLSKDDRRLSIEIWTNPIITKYAGGTYTEQQIIADHSKIERRCGEGCIGVWTIRKKPNEEKIGTCALLPMPVEEDDTDWDLVVGNEIPDGEIEIGYFLKEAEWGKGYATEACKRLLQFAFEDSPLTKIVAVIDDENEASRHVLQKSGLRSTGFTKAYGEQCASFRITRQEWLDNTNAK